MRRVGYHAGHDQSDNLKTLEVKVSKCRDLRCGSVDVFQDMIPASIYSFQSVRPTGSFGNLRISLPLRFAVGHLYRVESMNSGYISNWHALPHAQSYCDLLARPPLASV